VEKTVTFLWPHEPWSPASLFKHVVYLGETAAYMREFARIFLIDLSVTHISKKEITSIFRQSDYVCIPLEAYTVRNALKLQQLVKQTSNAKVVVYGTIVPMNPVLFAKHFDIIISTGHWYRALKHLIQEPDTFAQSMHGNIYRKNEPMDVSEWALPPLDLLPMKQYMKIAPNQYDIGVQIGCTHNCTFCAEKALIPEPTIYCRPPSQIKEFMEKNPDDGVYYIDATTFTQNREWARKTCELLLEINPVRKWRTVTRIDTLDQELMDLMSRSGCFKIGFGIETLSKSLQRSINKTYNESKLWNTLQMVIQAGIIPRCFLILGLPGQTAEDVRYTQEFMRSTGVEYRWKEYVPFNRIPGMTSLDEFEDFERTDFFMYDIPGLTRDEYISLLSVER
jgi:anaerobic magnesium-protoporphyrin IX monomethyl ester cyclase